MSGWRCTASLTVWPIPDDGVLYVDGHGHAAQPVEVLAGHHLVQVAVGAEVAWAWTGELPTGESLALETGLPEPTQVRFLRDNKLLLGGLVAGLGVGGAWYPVLKYGDRFLLGADRSSFYDDTTAYPDPVTTVEGDWRRYQAMRAGLVVGTAAATALVATHVVLRLRARQGA